MGDDLMCDPNGETMPTTVLLPLAVGAELNKLLAVPPEALIAVTSRPPSRKISNLRFLKFGNTCEPLAAIDAFGVGTFSNCTEDADVFACTAVTLTFCSPLRLGVGLGASLSLSNKSITSGDCKRCWSLLLRLPSTGVMVAVLAVDKYGMFSFSMGCPDLVGLDEVLRFVSLTGLLRR